jgi:hypothetical protein
MGVLDAAKYIDSAEKFKLTARLGHVVIEILNRARYWAHGHDAVQQMLAGFWRQIDVYKPSAEFYSRASLVSKKFKALAPYLAAVANTDKNIAAAFVSAGRFADMRDSWVSSGAAFAAEMEHLFLHGPSDKSVIMTTRLQHTLKPMSECLEAYAMRPCRDTQSTAIKESFRIGGLTFIITSRGGFIFDRPHLESLRECSARIAAYREFLSICHVIGGSTDLGPKMAAAARALEKHMAASIVVKFPGGNSLVACAMKHCRTAFLNQVIQTPTGSILERTGETHHAPDGVRRQEGRTSRLA